MMKQKFGPAPDEAIGSADITEGGTDARTKITACKNLGLVSRDQVRKPGGVIILGEDGFIQKSDLPPDLLNADIPSLFGPAEVRNGEKITIWITNYSSDVEYLITTVNGTFYREVDRIEFTGGNDVGEGSITVNGRTLTFYVGPVRPATPSIISPYGEPLQFVGPRCEFTSSAFVAGLPGDTHTSTDWRIARDFGMSNVALQKTFATGSELLTWMARKLESNTQYYIQVRHRANTDAISHWSEVLPFKTRVSFIPDVYSQVVVPGQHAIGDAAGESVGLSNQGSWLITGIPGHDTGEALNRGAASIFKRVGDHYEEKAMVTTAPTQLSLSYTFPLGSQLMIDPNVSGVQPTTVNAAGGWNIPAASDMVTLTGHGVRGTMVWRNQAGNPSYPDGLPVYVPEQAYIETVGNEAYPNGLPAYVAGYTVPAVGDPAYPQGLPVYAPAYLKPAVGVAAYPNGLPRYKPADFMIDQEGLPEYPNGLPPYEPEVLVPQQGDVSHPDGLPAYQASYVVPGVGSINYPAGLPAYVAGQPYVAQQGLPEYPNGLPVYQAEGYYAVQGESLVVTYGNQEFVFPGSLGNEDPQLTTQVICVGNFYKLGYSVAMSDNGNVAAAAALTGTRQNRVLELIVPTGGHITVETDAASMASVNYTSSTVVNLPSTVTDITLKGAGSQAPNSINVAAFNQDLTGSGSISLNKNARSVTITAKGGDGKSIAQQGDPAYPTGLPAYNPGQAYVAPSGWVDTVPATYEWALAAATPSYAYGTRTRDASTSELVAESEPAWPTPIYLDFASLAEIDGSVLNQLAYVKIGMLGSEEYLNDDVVDGVAVKVYKTTGSYWVYKWAVKTAEVPGHYTNPGQEYVAPVGNASYPQGLPAYAAAQSYTGNTTTVTVAGQTFTFQGGVGGPAVSRSEIVQLNGIYSETVNYNVGLATANTTAGYANLSYAGETVAVRTIPAMDQTYVGNGSLSFYRGTLDVTLRGKGANGTTTIVPAVQAVEGRSAGYYWMRGGAGTNYTGGIPGGQSAVDLYFTDSAFRNDADGAYLRHEHSYVVGGIPSSSGIVKQIAGVAPKQTVDDPTIDIVVTYVSVWLPEILPVEYSPEQQIKNKGADTTVTLKGVTYTFPGGDGVAAVETLKTATLNLTEPLNGSYAVASGGSLRVSHPEFKVPVKAAVALNRALSGNGSLSIAESVLQISLRLKGSDGATTIVGGQGNPSYPNGLPPYSPGTPGGYRWCLYDTIVTSSTTPVVGVGGTNECRMGGDYDNVSPDLASYMHGSITITLQDGMDSSKSVMVEAQWQSQASRAGEAWFYHAGSITKTYTLPGGATNQIKYSVTCRTRAVATYVSGTSGTGLAQYPSGLPPYVAGTPVSTNGVASTATVLGVTYSAPGGLGIPAVEKTWNIPLTGLKSETLSYSIATNGSGNVSHTAYSASGATTEPSIAIITGTSYVFPGIYGGVSEETTYDVSFTEGQDAGAVLYMERTNDTWATPKTLIAPDTKDNLKFGHAVDFTPSGGRMVVGAPGSSTPSVYVYARENYGYRFEQQLNNLDGLLSEYGADVKISQDQSTLIVAAPGTSSERGCVHVYTRTGTTSTPWVYHSKIQAPNPLPYDRFGHAVDLSADGKVIAIGAPGYTATGRDDVGGVFVYRKTGNAYAIEATLTGTLASTDARIGSSVSINDKGTVICTGAPGSSISGTNKAGAIFTFAKNTSAWVEDKTLYPPVRYANDALSENIALAADSTYLAIGAPKHDHTNKVDAGAVIVFEQED